MNFFIDPTGQQAKAIFYSDKFQQIGYKLGISKQAGLNLHIAILDSDKAKLYANRAFKERIKSAEQVIPDGTQSTDKMHNFRKDIVNKKVSGFAMGSLAIGQNPIKSSFSDNVTNLFSHNRPTIKFDVVLSMYAGLTRSALAIASNVPQLPVLVDESAANDLMAHHLCCPKFGYPPVSQLFDKNSPVYRMFCNTQHPEIGKYPTLNPR
jgi:hypothetical protein